jgi:hypothetical protein
MRPTSSHPQMRVSLRTLRGAVVIFVSSTWCLWLNSLYPGGSITHTTSFPGKSLTRPVLPLVHSSSQDRGQSRPNGHESQQQPVSTPHLPFFRPESLGEITVTASAQSEILSPSLFQTWWKPRCVWKFCGSLDTVTERISWQPFRGIFRFRTLNGSSHTLLLRLCTIGVQRNFSSPPYQLLGTLGTASMAFTRLTIASVVAILHHWYVLKVWIFEHFFM